MDNYKDEMKTYVVVKINTSVKKYVDEFISLTFCFDTTCKY